MTGSASIGGVLREAIRGRATPQCYEARIASDPDTGGRVYVTCRALTGDRQRLGPAPGAHPVASSLAGVVTLRAPRRDDRCWVNVDESGQAVVIVAWEPVG